MPTPVPATLTVEPCPASGREAWFVREGPTRTTVGLLAAGFVPLLAAAALHFWQEPARRFFPLAILAGCWLLRRAWRSLPAEPAPGNPGVTRLLLGIAWAQLAVATLLWSPWLGAAALLVALAGMIWWRGGASLLRRMVPGWLMLFIVLPLPVGWDFTLLEWLGGKCLHAVSRLLFEFGFPHFISRAALEVPHLQIPLADITRLMWVLPGLVAFGLFVPFWLRRPWWHALADLVAGGAFGGLVVFAAMLSGLRLSQAWGTNVFAGGRQPLLLVGAAVAGMLLLVSFELCFRFFTAPILKSRRAAQHWGHSAGPKVFAPRTSRGQSWALAFAALGLLQLPLGGWQWSRERTLAAPPLSRLPAGAQFALPPTLGEWRQVAALPLLVPEWPARANVALREWCFEQDGLGAVVRFGYPSRGFEDPVQEGTAAGWQVLDSRLRSGTGANGPVVEQWIQRDWQRVGARWIAALDEAGTWRTPDRHRPGLIERFSPKSRPAEVARVEVVVFGREELTDADRERGADLLATVRTELAREFLAQLQPRKP